MCTVTLVLPNDYPRPDMSGPIEALAGQPAGDCYVDSDHLVWYSQGWYYNFSWQCRKLVLSSVSDYNPFLGKRPLPLATALANLAMAQVDNMEIRRHHYLVSADAGNRLRRVLRDSFGTSFLLSRWSVKNYFGPLPFRKIKPHYLKLLNLAEEAILKPAGVVLVAAEGSISLEPQANMTLMLVDKEDNIFKCRLTENRLRITNAAPNGNFRIHDYRNSHIHITDHCLERFVDRIMGQDPATVNPLLAQASLLAELKNRRVGRSCILGRTAFINVEGNIFIGALSRGKLTLVTVYPETCLSSQAFQAYVLALLENKGRILDA